MDDLRRSRILSQIFTAISILLIVAIMAVPKFLGSDDFILALSGLVTINAAAVCAAGYFSGQVRILSKLYPDVHPER